MRGRKSGSSAAGGGSGAVEEEEEEDPFAEQPMRPVLQTEEKLLEALRHQLTSGLLSLEDYEKAAKGAVTVLAMDNTPGKPIIHRPGTTLRLVMLNERRQLQLGFLSPDEFARLRRAALDAEIPSSAKGSKAVSSSPPPKDVSLSSPTTPKSVSPRPARQVSPRPAAIESPPPVYVPFVGEATKTLGKSSALRKRGKQEAVALQLTAEITRITRVERYTYLGQLRTNIAFFIQIHGSGVTFSVVRRYPEFLRVIDSLREFFPDSLTEWPTSLPKKNQFVEQDAAQVDRIKGILNGFLNKVCSTPALLRSRDFVRFIDPKANPSLNAIPPEIIVRCGWVKFRKASSATFRRLFAVLSMRRILYLYGSDEKDKSIEPIFSIQLELIRMDVSYGVQMHGECIELHRFGTEETSLFRPEVLRDFLPWISDLRKMHSDRIHAKCIPLIPNDQVDDQLRRKTEAVREARSVTFLKHKLAKPSMKKLYYEADRVNSNILFQSNNPDLIRAATPTKLVESLLSHRLSPGNVIVSFVLTFHSFLSPADLLDQLMSYYRKPPAGVGATAASVVTKSPRKSKRDHLSSECLRIVSLLQKWLSFSSQDFEDPLLLASLVDFTETEKITSLVFKNAKALAGNPEKATKQASILTQSSGAPESSRPRTRSNSVGSIEQPVPPKQTATKSPRARVELDVAGGTVKLTSKPPVTKRKQIPNFSSRGSSGTSAAASKSASSALDLHRRRRLSAEKLKKSGSSVQVLALPLLPFGFPKIPWDLFSLAPAELARQLTLHAFSFFKKLGPQELLNQRWSKADGKLRDSPHVVEMIAKFNIISGVVTTAVVRVEDGRDRAACICFWIDVCSALFRHNDFSNTMAVLSGLSNASVYRLNRTWNVVRQRWPHRYAEFLKLSETLSSDRNYSNMRNALRSANPPALPYLGLFLQDLTFVDDGNKDWIVGGTEQLVNWEKRLMTANIIQDLLLFQTVPYTFPRVEEIQRYLARFRPISAEKTYALSLMLEPRVG